LFNELECSFDNLNAVARLLGLDHKCLEVLVNSLKLAHSGAQLFLDISGLENVLKIHPRLLYLDPLFNGIRKSEQVLSEVVSLSSHALNESVT